MTIVFSAIRTILLNWVVANVPVGMPVILYYQNAPQPTVTGQPVDYVTIYISSVVQIGRDYIQDPGTDAGVSVMVGDREFTLQLQAYGGDPLTILENLRTSLQEPTILATLQAQGLVYVDWYPIQDITQLIDSRYQNRGSWDSRWRLAQNYTDTVGVIDTTNVEEVILNVTGAVISDVTITIPPV